MVWPGQQWVVERELVSRLRETMRRAGLAIPGDRISVSYSAGREEKEIAPLLRRHFARLMARFSRNA
jgi:hypothetical protein